MPIYENYCSKCDRKEEEIRPVSACESPSPCSQCKGPTRPNICKTGFRLAGDGWYETMCKHPLDRKNVKTD